MLGARVQQALRLAPRLRFQLAASSPALRAGCTQPAELGSSDPAAHLRHFGLVTSGSKAGALRSSAEDYAAPFRAPCIWSTERGLAKKAPVKQPPAKPKAKPAPPRPPVQPNEASSVKNRNHKKRMLQRAEFAKKQAQDTIKSVRLSIARRDSARVKRWKEGAERARAWAQVLASRKQPRNSVPESVSVAQ